MDNKVGVNDFVKRQTKNSGKTYTTLNFEYIAKYAQKQINNNNFRNGYRDGVIIVDIIGKLTENLICPFVKLDKSIQIKAEIAKRRDNEEHYIRVKALNGNTLKTGKVELILYRNNDASYSSLKRLVTLTISSFFSTPLL